MTYLPPSAPNRALFSRATPTSTCNRRHRQGPVFRFSIAPSGVRRRHLSAPDVIIAESGEDPIPIYIYCGTCHMTLLFTLLSAYIARSSRAVGFIDSTLFRPSIAPILRFLVTHVR